MCSLFEISPLNRPSNFSSKQFFLSDEKKISSDSILCIRRGGKKGEYRFCRYRRHRCHCRRRRCHYRRHLFHHRHPLGHRLRHLFFHRRHHRRHRHHLHRRRFCFILLRCFYFDTLLRAMEKSSLYCCCCCY